MPNAYYLVLEANRQKLTLRVSLPAQEAKHSARRPGLGAPKAFGTEVDLLKSKALLQCSLNYNTPTLRKPHRYLPIESNQKSTSAGYFLGLWIQSAKLHQTPQ